MRTVYLDPKLKDMGWSGVTIHRGDLLHVSRGVTNSYSAELDRYPQFPLVVITLNASSLSVVGNETHLKEIMDAKGKEISSVALRLFLSALDSDDFAQVLQEAWVRGVTVGRQELQSEIRGALGL